MSGVSIVGALIAADAALLALVDMANVRAGRLPDGVALPALLVRSTSTTERKRLKRAGTARVSERISVTIRAASFREITPIVRALRTACIGQHGTIGECQAVAVTSAGTGPDLIGPADTYERTQDFTVGFDEPA